MRITEILVVALLLSVNQTPRSRLAAGFDSASVEGSHDKTERRQFAEKPVIFTFFNAMSRLQSTSDADDQLLQTWREAWSRAGWKPVILSLKTAQRHPDFDTIKDILDGLFVELDRYCFLRWLAFAEAGGGFVADYDTLPLNFVTQHLPNGGNLTVHESGLTGGVPSLVSATADEYTRFAWSLTRTVQNHANESHWNDMKAMQHIYRTSNGTAYAMESNVLNAVAVLNKEGFDLKSCGRVEGKYGLHFSRDEKKFGNSKEDRATIGAEWLDGWRIVCAKNGSTSTSTVPAHPAAKGYNESASEKSVTGRTTTEHFQSVAVDRGLGNESQPSIYTFFTGVTDKLHNTGMTDAADNLLLQTWREEWSRAGWKPVILSLDHAKQHPDYETISAMLKGPFGEYDRFCFLRWLAFAAAGGGFVADYDTLPLKFVTTTLPNGGKLTVHEQSGDGGVPSLVSATPDEYTRFARSLAETIGSHKNESHWSDMKAMQHIYKTSNATAYIMQGNVMTAVAVLNGRGYDDFTCSLINVKYGLHFSHHAIRFGETPIGSSARDRANIAKEWLAGWRKFCDGDGNSLDALSAQKPTIRQLESGSYESDQKAIAMISTAITEATKTEPAESQLNTEVNGKTSTSTGKVKNDNAAVPVDSQAATGIDSRSQTRLRGPVEQRQSNLDRSKPGKSEGAASNLVEQIPQVSAGDKNHNPEIEVVDPVYISSQEARDARISASVPAASAVKPHHSGMDSTQSSLTIPPLIVFESAQSKSAPRGTDPAIEAEGLKKDRIENESVAMSDEAERATSVSNANDHGNAPSISPNEAAEAFIRPVIYTFMEHADASTLSQDDDAMITVWMMSWFEVGWEPRVLWLNAAQKHRGFDGLNTLLQSVASKESTYFFLRWLAMANVGGGWLSDYDVMPLDKVPTSINHLPNGGKMTIHEASKNGGVPSLVSGSADEYWRLLNEIVANALTHAQEPFWSESYALQELHQLGSGEKYFMQPNVVWVQGLFNGRAIDPGICTFLDQNYAVHVSGDFVSRSDVTFAYKSTVARNWVLDWRRVCLGQERTPR